MPIKYALKGGKVLEFPKTPHLFKRRESQLVEMGIKLINKLANDGNMGFRTNESSEEATEFIPKVLELIELNPNSRHNMVNLLHALSYGIKNDADLFKMVDVSKIMDRFPNDDNSYIERMLQTVYENLHVSHATKSRINMILSKVQQKTRNKASVLNFVRGKS